MRSTSVNINIVWKHSPSSIFTLRYAPTILLIISIYCFNSDSLVELAISSLTTAALSESRIRLILSLEAHCDGNSNPTCWIIWRSCGSSTTSTVCEESFRWQKCRNPSSSIVVAPNSAAVSIELVAGTTGSSFDNIQPWCSTYQTAMSEFDSSTIQHESTIYIQRPSFRQHTAMFLHCTYNGP